MNCKGQMTAERMGEFLIFAIVGLVVIYASFQFVATAIAETPSSAPYMIPAFLAICAGVGCAFKHFFM